MRKITFGFDPMIEKDLMPTAQRILTANTVMGTCFAKQGKDDVVLLMSQNNQKQKTITMIIMP